MIKFVHLLLNKEMKYSQIHMYYTVGSLDVMKFHGQICLRFHVLLLSATYCCVSL